jgi:hypothetical protein
MEFEKTSWAAGMTDWHLNLMYEKKLHLPSSRLLANLPIFIPRVQLPC